MDISTVLITKFTEASIFTFLEIFLGFLAIWYFIKRPVSKTAIIDEEERERRLSQWNPEPLICEVSENHPKLTSRIVTGPSGKYLIVNDKKCLNLATHNYLGLIDNDEIRTKSTQLIHKYGVGSCGPRGFYGTLDVHLNLEDRLAQFMNAEAAVIYSYAFSTIASAIPAYCKRGDVIFADEMISFAAQKGIDAARSTVRYFKHNDTDDLERLLKEQWELIERNPKKTKRPRLFLIIEGIYFNTGLLCPLPEMVRLRHQYKLRLFLDESQSFGVLGATGRGITEHFNVDREKEVDLIISSLESSIGSTGGFCVGSQFIIEHQRLSGLGYCFSASCPPLLCQAAIEALDYIESTPKILQMLRDNCDYLHRKLQNVPHLTCSSYNYSPVKHLYSTDPDDKEAHRILDNIIKYCENNGFAVTKSAYIEGVERCEVRPSIRLTVNAHFTKAEIDRFVDTLIRTNQIIL